MGSSGMNDELVRLNVGGVTYTTMMSTLSRYPDSMIGAMFNGSMRPGKDDQGCYFIDRNGELFKYVLDFLRSSQLTLPEKFDNLDGLAVEADFYQINPLIEAIKAEQGRKLKAAWGFSGHMLEIIEVRTGLVATMPTFNARVKTIISARKDIIMSMIPVIEESCTEKLHGKRDSDFTELELNGSNIRLRLGEYLKQTNWRLQDTHMSSSSAIDPKNVMGVLLIEHSYKDRWILDKQRTSPEEASTDT
ncbi:unnamed protein product [Owenia fusiformis]|uniref:Uncharacterized protein n=1 Tax=Owenia fusiformis TaxID=6347 RepID=A0A8J1UIY8_OWEFU|nr:unnamed protein product [Owenia fusiformis]